MKYRVAFKVQMEYEVTADDCIQAELEAAADNMRSLAEQCDAR